MIVKFLFRLLNEGGFRRINDDSGVVSPATRTRLREEKAAHQRLVRERAEGQEQEKKEDADSIIDVAVVSDSLRLAYEDLGRDIGDAIRAVRIAYEQALLEQEQARLALEEAQENALVLADGRRVYFKQDGRLFDEDRKEIRAAADVAEAQRLRLANPDATGFEAYSEMADKFTAATARTQHLAETLENLDNLNNRYNTGKITQEEFYQRQQELEEAIKTMPPDVRQKYERMRAARHGADSLFYRKGEPALQAAPDMNAQFTRASEAFEEQTLESKDEADVDVDRQPAYRSAPDF